MHFISTPLQDAFLIELNKREDERGFFARLFCSDEFSRNGLESSFIQANNSLSTDQGTLRGLHYQLASAAETKLVRCIQGSLFDVILDLRDSSPTFGNWFGTILSQENRKMMYVPKGFAHGFLTLAPNSEVIYLVSAPYSKELERGIRWNDPRFHIEWPEPPRVISERDAKHPDFEPNYHLNPGL
jgi:dTDP-4-dehydrorhamnose 3,5-epimerase